MFTYIKKHWDGDLPLWKAYWVNGILALMFALVVGFTLGFIFGIAARPVPNIPQSVYEFMLLPVTIWLLVGVWKSATKYTGSVIIKYFVYFVVVLRIFLTGASLFGAN